MNLLRERRGGGPISRHQRRIIARVERAGARKNYEVRHPSKPCRQKRSPTIRSAAAERASKSREFVFARRRVPARSGPCRLCRKSPNKQCYGEIRRYAFSLVLRAVDPRIQGRLPPDDRRGRRLDADFEAGHDGRRRIRWTGCFRNASVAGRWANTSIQPLARQLALSYANRPP